MPTKRDYGGVSLKLSLPKQDANATDKNLAICPVDAEGNVIETTKISNGETFKISEKAMKAAKTFAIVSTDAEPAEALEAGLKLSPSALTMAAAGTGVLSLSPGQLNRLFPPIICVSGEVEHCWYWPWWQNVLLEQSTRLVELPKVTVPTALSSVARKIAAVRPAPETLTLAPWCRPICDGVVEVFERVCCRRPVLIDEIFRADVLKRLDQIPVPDLKIPGPSPDPVPIEEIPALKTGAVDHLELNAVVDREFIARAKLEEIEPYIAARPYLQWFWWSCGTPVRRGVTVINPDGSFTLCHPMGFAPGINCKREYAFKVTQIINGAPVVIYDGLAANAWFGSDEDIVLKSFHRQAIPCSSEPPSVPAGTAFAMLDKIGGTEAWNLQTPAQDGRHSVQTPDAIAQNDGLAFPVATPAEAVGRYKNRNWASILNLRYLFTDPLYAHAKHYRVSVARANGAGDPVGGWTYLDDDISWVRYEVAATPSGPDITIIRETLNVNEAPSFYRIPNPNQNWLSGYPHARLDTRTFANGRHLVRLELYDGDRNLLRPSVVIGDDDGTAAPFTYEWWHDDSVALGVMPETTTEVPRGALTHMFWWDNRDCIAEIDNLVHNGVPNSGNCQFISGTPGSTFAATIRASHPEPIFMHSWNVRYQRGLHGSWEGLDSSTVPVNPGVTATDTLAEMLDEDTRCTFSLELYVHTKAFNGSTVNALDERDNASFALDQSG